MKGKKIPFDAVMAMVVVGLILIMAVDGFAVQNMPMEAARYPIFVFLVAGAAGAAEIVRSIRKRDGTEEKPVFENRGNFLWAVGMIAAYVLLMWLAGFMLSTILFSVAFAWRFKLKNQLVFDAAAVVAVIAVYFCFKKLLYIFLPAGLLVDLIF